MDDVLAAGLAGLIAGIAVAMPLGAIGVLLVSEGMTAGWRPAAAGAAGVAFVDFAYSGLAVAAGASLSRALLGWEKAIHIGGAVLLVIIASAGWPGSWAGIEAGIECGQFYRGSPGQSSPKCPRPAPRSGQSSPKCPRSAPRSGQSPWKSPHRCQPARRGRCAHAFVVAVFAASLSWQLILATFGAIAGARLPPAARTVTGLAGYVVVLAYAGHLAFG